jgi:CRP-like cAMP-binding protein
MSPGVDVSAIVEQVKARIKQVEGELAKHERLSDELERLRDALGRLEGAVRAQVRGRSDGGRPAASATRARPGGAARSRGGGSRPTARSARRTHPTGGQRASTPARAPRGQNKAKVLEALKAGPMTASEIAKATGIPTGTASTLLTKLSKTGEVVKAERGYRLPDRA